MILLVKLWYLASNFQKIKSHFMKNHTLNLINLLSHKNYVDLVVWELKTSLG